MGTLVERGGKPALLVTGTGTVMAVEPDSAAAGAYRQVEEWRKQNTTASVELAGTVVTRGEDAPDAIVVRRARRAEGGQKP